MLVQPNGRIVVAGSTRKVTTAPSRFCVARLRSNGTLDTTFSGDGKKTFNWAPGDFSRTQAVLVLPDGKLVVAGFSGPEGGDIQAARLKANGEVHRP